MATYPPLYSEIHDDDAATANSVNSRLSEISNAIGRLGDGTDPLASPNIVSFVNGEHLHSDAASGGKLPFDNIDTTGATAGQKWVADGAGGGSWVSGYPIISDVVIRARISDDGNRWLRLDGRTIGNALSGATARDNEDMHDLFVHLWSESTNAELIIQDSSGTPTTRLGTAELDWDDDKRMPLPDTRGRTIVGMDDPTGADAANVITDAAADVLFGVMGEDVHVLIEAETPIHTHTVARYLESAGATRIHAVDSGAFDSNETSSSFGGGGSHNNVQPVIFMNYFIYTGN